MKAVALPLSIILALSTLTGSVLAQEDASVETDGEATPEVACLRLTSEEPLDGVGPEALAQMLLGGTAVAEVLEADRCATPESKPTPRPKRQKGTRYTRFVSRGAGAVIELALLVAQHEGADSLTDIDAAAQGLSAWAAKQRKWLNNHPPQGCYRAVHTKWSKAVVDVKQGSDALHQAISKGRWTDVAPAVQQVGAGLNRASNVDLEASTERCGDG